MEDNRAFGMGYEQIARSFRQLTDVRFKLLALVPSVSGIAIGLISKDLGAFEQAPLSRLIVAVFGLCVTLGIVFYDQRNSQIYDALSHRGRELERALEISGPFSVRPGRALKFLGVVTIWHDRGLAFIYGSVLGAWVFPIACGLLWLLPAEVGPSGVSVPTMGAGVAALSVVVAVVELHRLDRQASRPPESPRATEEADEIDLPKRPIQ